MRLTTSCDSVSTTAQNHSRGLALASVDGSLDSVAVQTTYTLLPSGSTPTPDGKKSLCLPDFKGHDGDVGQRDRIDDAQRLELEVAAVDPAVVRVHGDPADHAARDPLDDPPGLEVEQGEAAPAARDEDVAPVEDGVPAAGERVRGGDVSAPAVKAHRQIHAVAELGQRAHDLGRGRVDDLQTSCTEYQHKRPVGRARHGRGTGLKLGVRVLAREAHAPQLGRSHPGQADAAQLLVGLGVDHPHYGLVLVRDVDEPAIGSDGDTPQVTAHARPGVQCVGLGVDEGQNAEWMCSALALAFAHVGEARQRQATFDPGAVDRGLGRRGGGVVDLAPGGGFARTGSDAGRGAIRCGRRGSDAGRARAARPAAREDEHAEQGCQREEAEPGRRSPMRCHDRLPQDATCTCARL